MASGPWGRSFASSAAARGDLGPALVHTGGAPAPVRAACAMVR